MAVATQERRLLGVGSSAWFGLIFRGGKPLQEVWPCFLFPVKVGTKLHGGPDLRALVIAEYVVEIAAARLYRRNSFSLVLCDQPTIFAALPGLNRQAVGPNLIKHPLKFFANHLICNICDNF